MGGAGCAIMASVARFLQKEDDPGSAKHVSGVAHGVVVNLLLHLVVLATGAAAEEAIAAGLGVHTPPLLEQRGPAFALVLYWALVQGARLALDSARRTVVVYDMAWSCNMSMVLAASALLMQRRTLLYASGCMVAIDQVLWYVDVIGWAIRGKFPLRVVGYLFDPQTSVAKKATCLHHFFFLPLIVLLALPSSSGGAALPLLLQGFAISAVQTVACQAVCRFCTPIEVRLDGNEDPVYLNINLCYEAYRGLGSALAWTKRFDRAPPHLFLPWMLFFWNAGNFLCFVPAAWLATVALTALPR